MRSGLTRHALTVLLLAVQLIVTMTVHAAAENRFALVIGIDRYEHLSNLGKARNDARAVSNSLTRLGFRTVLLEDADRRAISRAISNLAAGIQPGDLLLFYFAGHGVEIQGRNLLLASDAPAARPGDEAFLVAESIPVDQIFEILQARGPRVTLLILDACRDNPFPRVGTRSAGGRRGLAAIAAPEGSFVMFSAGTGQAALDSLGSADSDPNSVFTRALLPLLEVPGLPVQQMARLLRSEVETVAQRVNHRQRPAYYDELTGDFVLNTAHGTVEIGGTGESAAVTAPAAQTDPCERAVREWPAVAALADPTLLFAYADAHQNCEVFSRAAEARARELSAALAPSSSLVPPPPNWRVKAGVSEGYMNARSGPGTMHAILFRIPERTGGLIVGECRPPDPGGGRFDWCFVRYGERQGWVSINGLEPE